MRDSDIVVTAIDWTTPSGGVPSATVGTSPAATVVAARAPRIACPLFLRAELLVAGEGIWELFPSSTNSAGLFAMTVGYNAFERLSTEISVGTGAPSEQNPGLTMMAVGRVAVFVEPEARRSAVTLAAGPSLIAGGPYDIVAFGHAEIGYEYRGQRFTFLFSAGPDVTINDSARQSTTGCGSVGFFGGGSEAPCVRPFNRGDVFFHARIGFGVTFGGT